MDKTTAPDHTAKIFLTALSNMTFEMKSSHNLHSRTVSTSPICEGLAGVTQSFSIGLVV